MSTLPAVTEALTLATARGMCHVSSDNGGFMTLTATNMERGGAVTTQRNKWDDPWNREMVAAWAVYALRMENVREVNFTFRNGGYVLLFR